MIGAMPAVAVRHERRKGQAKSLKRPSQLYFGGHWLPPTSPSPTPSPNGQHHADIDDRLPEFYVCGKVSSLQIIVSSILLGAIVLIVGLVQLVPNAADADHRYIFLGAGGSLLFTGLVLAAVRCVCIHCRYGRRFDEPTNVVVPTTPPPPPHPEPINSVATSLDEQRRDTQVSNPSEYDVLIEDNAKKEHDEEVQKDDT